MALTINTNISSLYAQQYLGQNQNNLSNTLLKLSSGRRINNASDDPAGLAIAQNFQATINGLNMGARNAQDGVALVQTAQGAMTQILNNLQTMSNLTVQALNDTYSSSNLANMDAQFQALLTQISDITSKAKFNGVDLLAGGSLSIQTGNQASDTVSISLTSTSLSSLGLTGAGVADKTAAGNALTAINDAINSLTTGLATLGANQSGLNAVIQSNQTFATNLQSAMSNIMDADFAAETSNSAKYNILNQSGVAMLAQANAVPQLVLQLLRG
jgi:flagellin